MIARGDLAVECGYERMAEVQEEILWACEAAHMPVVWATQVLETLAKTGLPSRAEITDAAMGERAECVMLNKGPHILERDAHARRHPAAHAGAPVEEATVAARAEGLVGASHRARPSRRAFQRHTRKAVRPSQQRRPGARAHRRDPRDPPRDASGSLTLIRVDTDSSRADRRSAGQGAERVRITVPAGPPRAALRPPPSPRHPSAAAGTRGSPR